MIKENGNFIAVKVPKGAHRFRKNEMILLWEGNDWNGLDLLVQAGMRYFDFEIIGLISDISDLPDSDSRYSFGCIAGEVHPKEWNQWLIIKKL